VSTRRRLVPAAAASLMLAGWVVSPAALGAGELAIVTAPALPVLPGITITAKSQTVTTTMANFAITDTRGTKSGWNLTALGQTGVGKSAVFAQYCPNAKCGSDSEGYVAAGRTLAAKSLTLSSTGASLKGGTGSAPLLQCAAACSLDSATAVKVLSAATGGAGESTWTTSGFTATSLKLAVPTTLRVLPAAEVYRVNILWTLSTGP
jgi:hypothetical protein